MKTIITFAFLITSQLTKAGDFADYQIMKGKLHSGGKARVEVVQSSSEAFIVKLNYEIIKKILVPIPSDQLKGESVFELPPEFRDERGYLELETKGVMNLPNATLKFVKRLQWNQLNNAYQILILPKNGRSQIEAIYHPSIPAAGWARISITFINNIPIFNGYQVIIDLK